MESLKSFIVCTLVVMATTSAYKLTENHENDIYETCLTSTEDRYNGLKDFIKLDEEKLSNIYEKYHNRSLTQTAESFDVIVETAIVCDKEWGDLFLHNRQKILEYWTIFFWDMNVKYQTLPSVNITFRVTSVTVISTFEDQPFIEKTRDENGAASFDLVIREFGDWMEEQHEADKVANYDIAILAINTPTQEGYGGLGYVAQACSKNRGVMVFPDDGTFFTDAATHEIGHILGSNHDHQTSCDVVIPEYAMSEKGSCLRTIDEPGNPVIGQDFGGVFPPTVQEQCKAKARDPNAVVLEEDLGECRNVLCWKSVEHGGYGIRISLLENSECNHHSRCFRGRCRPVSAQLINVESNQCLLSGGGRFVGTDNTPAIMESCPQHQTPLNSVAKLAMNEGQYLMMAYASPDGREIGDKTFVYEEDQEQHLQLRFVKSSVGTGTGWSKGWTLRDVGNEQFLLSHTYTKKCLKQTGNGVIMTENCDENDKSMVWRFRK